MKKFIRQILFFLGIPLIILIGNYIVTDPFKNLHQFSLQNFSPVNREYVSTELFIKNKHKIPYNAFVFGSSRACGLNTYYWKSKIDSTAHQFLFQAWSETITGINEKISYLNQTNQKIDYALILIDINSSFGDEQEPTNAIAIKDYRLSGKPFFYNQLYFFLSYLKPTAIYKSVSDKLNHSFEKITFDTLSNDWIATNKDTWKIRPVQNKQYNKEKFQSVHIRNIEIKQLISPEKENLLQNIKNIFDKRKTKYRILICPEYAQTMINNKDLLKLEQIFGKENVFDFTGKNRISSDMYNFMDTGHFDLCAGYEMLDTMYKK